MAEARVAGRAEMTGPASPSRRTGLIWLALVLPAFLTLMVVAAKPVLADTPVGTNSMLLVLVAMAYLGACLWFSERRSTLGSLALVAWALLLSGGAGGGLILLQRNRSAAKSVDAVQEQWEKYFEGEKWFPEYVKEFRVSTRMEWRPYVLWRRKPFEGNHINVDADGLRRTWRLSGVAGRTLRIFMFGGSALWGNGARDDYTIPSYVARQLTESGHAVTVFNFAELGFVSSQNVITLMLELQKGNVPDLVVCYDGVNDVYATFQNRQASVPQYHRKMRSAMNDLFDAFYRKATSLPTSESPSASPSPPADEDLVAQTIDAYVGNLRFIDQLGVNYGFATLHFWQPVAFLQKPLTASEKDRVAPTQRLFGAFFEKAYSAMEAAETPSTFRNVSDLFATTSEEIYFDFCHVRETGNRMAAERLSPAIAKVLETRTQGPKSPRTPSPAGIPVAPAGVERGSRDRLSGDGRLERAAPAPAR